MADNTALNAGSGGDTLRDKDRAGVKTQIVGQDINPYGAEILGGGRDLGVGGAMYIDARPLVTKQTQTSTGLTTASTAYVTGDQLGTLLTFTSMSRVSGGTGRITGAALLDKAAKVSAVDLYLFDQTVTAAADNAAADFSDADMANLVNIVSLAGTAQTSNNVSTIHSISVPYNCNATSLFVALVTRTGHSFFGAVGDLILKLIYEQD